MGTPVKVEIYRGTAKAHSDKEIEIRTSPDGKQTRRIKNVAILSDMFEAFADAIRKNGDEPVINNEHKSGFPKPVYRHAVIFGTGRSYQNNGKSAIQDFRYQVRRQLNKRNGHAVCFDAGYYKTVGNYEYHRVGLGSPLNDGEFLHQRGNDDSRWRMIQKKYGVPYREWTPHGKNILIFIQPDNGFSMNYTSTASLLAQWVSDLKKITNKQIAIRAHPKSMKQGQGTIDVKKVCDQYKIPIYTHHDTPLYPLLDDTCCAITYNSTVAVETVTYGVPTIAFDNLCMAWDVCDHVIDAVNNPKLPDRTQWLNDIQHTEWCAKEIATGELWGRFKEEMARRDEKNGIV